MKLDICDKLGRKYSVECRSPILVIFKGREMYFPCCDCDDCKESMKERGYGLQFGNDKN